MMDDHSWIEIKHQVVVDISDESGQLSVYKYVQGTCIRVDFDGMNPAIDKVEIAARAIADLAKGLA